MPLIAKDYEILRDLEANGRKSIPLVRRPVRVATLIDEQRFLQSGGVLQHNVTIFLEDRFHDWDWTDGKFQYYTRVAERADVLVVYELVSGS